MRWLWLAFATFGALSLVAIGCGESEGEGDDDGASAGSAGQSASGAAGASSAGRGGAATAGTAGGVSGSSSGGSSAGTDGGDAGATSGGASSLEDCNAQHVTCKALPPQCASGQVPSVEGTCWAGCVKIERCACSAQEDCPDNNEYTCWGGRHCGPYVR